MTEKIEKGSNSTPFNEKQSDCPYCHEYANAEGPDWFSPTGKAIGNAEFYISVRSQGHAIIHNVRHEWQGIDIKYCPMCGRRLEAKHE